jgi:hypothetical protein
MTGGGSVMVNRMLALSLCLAAGLLGGTVSLCVTPTTAFAQAQLTTPKEIRAQRFTLVDEKGRTRRVFAIEHPTPIDGVVINDAGNAVIKLFDSNGHEVFHAGSASPRSLSQR